MFIHIWVKIVRNHNKQLCIQLNDNCVEIYFNSVLMQSVTFRMPEAYLMEDPVQSSF